MLPSVQEIQGFLEIAETLNITKAAGRMGLTQPSLSQSLKRLEETLGVELVIRSKSGVELTIAGKEFLKQARRLLQNWEDLRANTLRSVREVRGNVKIGCHPSVGLYTLDLFLPVLMEEHAGLEVTLVHDLSRKIFDKVINYEVDLGLVINPTQHPDVILHKVLEDEVKVWGVRGRVLDTLIIHPELLQSQDILKKMKKRGVAFRRVITTNNLEIIASLTLSGAGCGILPSRVVSIFDHDQKLKAIPNSPVFHDQLYLALRMENREIEAIKVINKKILEAFRG